MLLRCLTFLTASCAVFASAQTVTFDRAVSVFETNPDFMIYRSEGYLNRYVHIWNEQQGATLGQRLMLDISDAGSYGNLNELQSTWIEAGTRVNSTYIAYDPKENEIDTVISFDRPILGLIVMSGRPGLDRLTASDFLIPTQVPDRNRAKGHDPQRGLEMGQFVKGQGIIETDGVVLSGNSIRIHMKAKSHGDQIRVITAAG